MFATDHTTGVSHFRPASLQPLYMFELCGLLFGLALYNGITLPVSLPLAFYEILILDDPSWSIDSMREGWPELAQSFDSFLNEDVPGVDFSYPLEANGLRVTVVPPIRYKSSDDGSSRFILPISDVTPIVHHEGQNRGHEKTRDTTEMEASAVTKQSTASTGRSWDVDKPIEEMRDAWPGWDLVPTEEEPKEVTPESKERYVESYGWWLTHDSVLPQWVFFKKGFFAVIDQPTLKMLTPNMLKSILEGSTHLDINDLKRATGYDGYEPDSRYIQSFWRIVSNWPEEKQMQLLKFVTAAERVPAGGAKNLKFKIQRAYPASDEHLPTSSTCFGTLILPKYSTAEILEKKLSAALKYGLEGFGTG